MPIRKDDEVLVTRGTFKGREGKVVQVYRKKWVIHVERITREKVNGKPFFHTWHFRCMLTSSCMNLTTAPSLCAHSLPEDAFVHRSEPHAVLVDVPLRTRRCLSINLGSMHGLSIRAVNVSQRLAYLNDRDLVFCLYRLYCPSRRCDRERWSGRFQGDDHQVEA